jgi:hypothetical protein
MQYRRPLPRPARDASNDGRRFDLECQAFFLMRQSRKHVEVVFFLHRKRIVIAMEATAANVSYH